MADYLRYCFARQDEAIGKYGFFPDVWVQAERAYQLALAEKLDRDEFSLTEYSNFLTQYQLQIDIAKEQLALQRAQPSLSICVRQ